MSLSKEDIEVIREIVRGELNGIKEGMNEFRGELNGFRKELNRVKKSRGGLIIAPRVSHVRSLGNSMDRSDIEEIPNSAYKYR